MNGRQRPQPIAATLAEALLLSLLAAVSGCGPARPPTDRDWPVYKADSASSSYSPLDQVNRSNVSRLEVAWTFRSGDEELYTIECNPIVVNGIMYLTSPMVRVFALDAATGDVLWRFDPYSHGAPRDLARWGRVNRGVVYWNDDLEARIFFTLENHLYALNASDGSLIPSFGENGIVNLRRGLDRETADLTVRATSPGIVFKDLLILGSTVGEGPGPADPGHIRAYDVRSGKRVWIFHTIPHPGEAGCYVERPEAEISGSRCLKLGTKESGMRAIRRVPERATSTALL